MLVFISIISLSSFGQTARIKGIILDEFNNPVENVSVKAGEKGTVTNANGFYLLDVPSNKKITIIFNRCNNRKA